MRRALFAMLLTLCSLRALAQAPVVRAHLEPAGNIMVGQPVRLVVSVFVPNYFTGSPEFPEFEIENAIVVLPQDRPENSNTQVNGARYAGITQTYVIYPQQAGDFHVPTAKLSVPYAIAPPKSTTAEPSLPALSFHADVPAAARDLPYFLPTTHLTITQQWSRPLKGLRTGDSVERTITVTASKMQSMLIPPLPLEQPDGIRIYPGEPTTHDQKTAHGDFIYGQRVQTAKYLVQKAGDYTLPPVELQWWNLATRHLDTATLPAIKFSAVTNPDYVAELPPPPESAAAPVQKINLWRRYRRRTYLGFAVVAALAVLLVALKCLHGAWPRVVHWWRQRERSEAAVFRKLLRAVRADNAKQSYVDLLQWLNIVVPGMSLDQQLSLPALQPVRDELDRLTSRLYRLSTTSTDRVEWSGKELASMIRKAREGLSIHRERSSKSLFPLNPVPGQRLKDGGSSHA